MIYETLGHLAVMGAVNATGMVCAAAGYHAFRKGKAILAVAMGVCAYICLLGGMILPYTLAIKL